MEKGMVSIIIPVYNCEKYLKRCVKSVLGQTYHNLEVFLLDDGSKDESPIICDFFGEKDERVKVIHLKNHGVSAVRNYGMRMANGEYIQFVDGDDYLKPNMVATMVKNMEQKSADMVVCNYKRLLTKWLLMRNTFLNPSGEYTPQDYMKKTLRDAGHHYYGVVWNKLFKTDVIRTKQLSFPENVSLGEDFIFNMHYVENVAKIVVIGKTLYCYNRLSESSLSKKTHPGLTDCEREFSNRKIIYANYVDVFRRNGLYDIYKKQLKFYWIAFYVRQMVQLEIYRNAWSDLEIMHWKEQLVQDDMISQALLDYTDAEMDRMMKSFAKSSKWKKIVKEIVGIH